MSRVITELGELTPVDTKSVEVLRFDASKPETLAVFQLQGYPWLYRTTGDNSDQVAGAVKTQLKNVNGTWVDVWQVPYGLGDQETINEELQYFVRDHEVEGYNLPVVKEIVDGVLYMYSRQTPDNFKDIALTAVDKYGDFTVDSVDQNARTITVVGHIYTRTKPSNDGTYPSGKYMGMERFLRDELTGDPAIDLSWKRRQYDYGWIRVQPSLGGIYHRKVKYTAINDSPNIDAGSADNEFLEDSLHTITIAEGELSEQDWTNIAAGGVIKLYRRLPWISPQLATGGNFSQKYFIANMIMKLDNHSEQFFALWFWANYLKFFDGDYPEFFDVNGDPLYDFEEEQTQGSELDAVEWPGGGDWYTKYHNIHHVGGEDMQNFAANNGIDPVMDIGEEWEKASSCGHLVAIAKAVQDFIPYDEFFELQVSWLPPHHERNPRDVGVVIWDIAKEGEPLKFLCGCITPPHWDSDQGLPKQVFVTNAVGGTFVNNVRHIYARDLPSNKNTPTIVNQLKSLSIRQVDGYDKGGKGYPDSNSQMSRGYLAMDGDILGQSGTGIAASAVDNNGGVNPPSPPPVDNGDDDIINDGQPSNLPVDPNIARIRTLIKPTDGGSNITNITNNTTISSDISDENTTWEVRSAYAPIDGELPTSTYFSNRNFNDYHYINFVDFEVIYVNVDDTGWEELTRNRKIVTSALGAMNFIPYAGTLSKEHKIYNSQTEMEFSDPGWFVPFNNSVISQALSTVDDVTPLAFLNDNNGFGGTNAIDDEVSALANAMGGTVSQKRYGNGYFIYSIVAGNGTTGTPLNTDEYLALSSGSINYTPLDSKSYTTFTAWMKLRSGKLTMNLYESLHVDGVRHNSTFYSENSTDWKHYNIVQQFQLGYLDTPLPNLYMSEGSELLVAVPAVLAGKHVIEPHTSPISSYPSVGEIIEEDTEFDQTVADSTTVTSQDKTYGVLVDNTIAPIVLTIREDLPVGHERTISRTINSHNVQIQIGDGNTELIRGDNWVNLNAIETTVTIKKHSATEWKVARITNGTAGVVSGETPLPIMVNNNVTVAGSAELNVNASAASITLTLDNSALAINDEVGISFFKSDNPITHNVIIASNEAGAVFSIIKSTTTGDTVTLSQLSYARYRKIADNTFEAVRQYLYD